MKLMKVITALFIAVYLVGCNKTKGENVVHETRKMAVARVKRVYIWKDEYVFYIKDQTGEDYKYRKYRSYDNIFDEDFKKNEQLFLISPGDTLTVKIHKSNGFNIIDRVISVSSKDIEEAQG